MPCLPRVALSLARIQAALGLARQRTSTALVPELDRIEREADCLNELIGQILITDCGPGVPEPMLNKIFEPFVRVGEARDRQSGGYGLGLAIALPIAPSAHITAPSKPEIALGGGLIVTIHLPQS